MNPNTSKENKMLSGNKTWLTIAVVFFLLLIANDNSDENGASTPAKTYAEPSSSAISQCKILINEKTMYEVDRLNYTNSAKGHPVVTYYSDAGIMHVFKCVNNKLKIYAKGAGTWLEM